MPVDKLEINNISDEQRLTSLLGNVRYLTETDLGKMRKGDVKGALELLNTDGTGPFSRRSQKDIDKPHIHLLRIMRNPEYFPFTCEHIFNIKIFPFQHVMLKLMWHKVFPMVIGSRGASKTFTIALYAMLKALLCQGTKIVIVGAAFRQSKLVFEYCQRIWNDAPVLQSLCVGPGYAGKEQGPRMATDRCEMIIGQSTIVALPLGDGSKIRGHRANVVIADEFSCLDANTIVETTCGLMRISESFNQPNLSLYTGDDSLKIEDTTKYIKTPLVDAYKVTTNGGYSFICSSIHQSWTTKGWKLAKDLTTEDSMILENNYQFPADYVAQDDLVVNEELAWLMGILLAEGSIKSKHTINIKMNDKGCIDRIARILEKYSPNNKVGICYRQAYIDKRGWDCKESWQLYCCNIDLRTKLADLGLDRVTAHSKKIPWSILRSPKSVVISFLAGLLEGDGSCFISTDKRNNKKRLGVAYYSVCEQLCSEVQTLFWKLGIYFPKQSRIGSVSPNLQWMLRCNGRNAYKLYNLLKIKKWENIFIEADDKECQELRTKPYYDKERDRWSVGYKKNGKFTRKRFKTYKEAESFLVDDKSRIQLKIRSVELLPEKRHLYDYYLPQTHSFYGNCFRQHNSINPNIFETIVKAFGSTSQDPVANAERETKISILKNLGLWTKEQEDKYLDEQGGNQCIISGTPDYDFMHFAQYWKRYKAIIETRGDRKKLAEVLGGEDKIDKHLNWKDFAIIRLPSDVLPKGFMDPKALAGARATSTESNFQLEYGAVFVSDSDGFFKRSLIEKCVVGKPGSDIPYNFNPQLIGEPGIKHVIAIDPASEKDNCVIIVLAIHGNHRRIVHCWSTNKKHHSEKLKYKLTKEHDFYKYVVRKARDLLKVFPADLILVDSQGGGFSIREAFGDPDKIQQGEDPIYEVIVEDDEKYTDTLQGKHILQLINFANAQWICEANTMLKKDFEDKALLFPFVDSVAMELAFIEDNEAGRISLSENGNEIKLYDTLEDCVAEIEELKNELCLIVHTKTPSGRDHWDTPGIQSATSKRGRMRKDRYSALLMANMGARGIQRAHIETPYQSVGGFAGSVDRGKNVGNQMYYGLGASKMSETGYRGGTVNKRIY